jgi:hypothetical protein
MRQGWADGGSRSPGSQRGAGGPPRGNRVSVKIATEQDRYRARSTHGKSARGTPTGSRGSRTGTDSTPGAATLSVHGGCRPGGGAVGCEQAAPGVEQIDHRQHRREDDHDAGSASSDGPDRAPIMHIMSTHRDEGTLSAQVCTGRLTDDFGLPHRSSLLKGCGGSASPPSLEAPCRRGSDPSRAAEHRGPPCRRAAAEGRRSRRDGDQRGRRHALGSAGGHIKDRDGNVVDLTQQL